MLCLAEQEQQEVICSSETLQTFEARNDEYGNIRLPELRRAYVTILHDEPDISETALLSEAALAEDWNRPQEDMAWSNLE